MDDLKKTLAKLQSMRDKMMKRRAKVPGTNVSAGRLGRMRTKVAMKKGSC